MQILLLTLKNYFTFSITIIIAIYVSYQFLTIPVFFTRFIDIVFYGIVALLVFRLGIQLLNAMVDYQKSQESANIHIVEFFRIIARGFLIVIISIWALSNVGVDVTSFIASLGILTLAIAFSLKEILSDVFASIVIFIDKPFEVGDAIKVENDAGSVERIGIRSTRIRSGDGHLIVASNRELTNKKIHNLKRMKERRISLQIQIHKATPTKLLKEVPQILTDLIESDENLRFNKVNLNKIGNYSFDYELVYFVKSSDFRTHAISKHNFFINLLETFEEYDVYMPYPTQTVIIEE